MKNTVIVCALPSELSKAYVPPMATVVYSGVGKVNAALATNEAIGKYRPDLIINFGTAGRLHERIKGLVEVASVIQHDMMAMPIADRGVTPFNQLPPVLRSGFGGVTCATGDSFVTDKDPWLVESGVDVVDMELFAIASACHKRDVPWRAFKFITDDANEHAADNWQSNVGKGMEAWRALVRSV